MKTINIRKHIVGCLTCCSIAAATTVVTSCSDYLEIKPENVQTTDEYWQSKEEVEATLMAGYYYLRSSVEDNLIPWGELRAGCVAPRGNNVLQKMDKNSLVKNNVSKWASMYKIVNAANLVLLNAQKALDSDDTYDQNQMNSHHCEALWQRALAYFYIVRNWRDAPLITEPYETDEETLNIAKSSESEIIAQIKADLQRAIALDAAKEKFNTTWETKGRATKWAILALMTDVCLWNHDYDEAISYADQLINSTSTAAPRFITTKSRSAWFAMFNPGNSNESIFEVQWSYSKLSQGSPQTNNLSIYFNPNLTGFRYLYSSAMLELFRDEIRTLRTNNTTAVASGDNDIYGRSLYAGINVNTSGDAFENATAGYVWKYYGGSSYNTTRSEQEYDCNFIIYRVADVMLMKAEALVMRQMGASDADNQAALDIVNQIRQRTNLQATTEVTSTSSVSALLLAILNERLLEFAGEGKAWYDMLRIGRYNDPSGQTDFKSLFINTVTTYNTEQKVRSILGNQDAWYLPVNNAEISVNELMEQNPYYM